MIQYNIYGILYVAHHMLNTTYCILLSCYVSFNVTVFFKFCIYYMSLYYTVVYGLIFYYTVPYYILHSILLCYVILLVILHYIKLNFCYAILYYTIL